MNSFIQSMLQTDLYKRTQGRMVRQGTAFAVILIFFIAAYQISGYYLTTINSRALVYGIGIAIAALGLWFGIRLVNYPRFADFLISVEAEMHKVSWPTRPELIRSSIVVIVVLFFLGALLFAYDFIWWIILEFGFTLMTWIASWFF